MKKMFFLILSLVITMNMNMITFAADVTGGTIGDYSADVIGTYNSNTGEVKYSVDIIWSGLSFTYNAGNKEWDTINHKYDITGTGWVESNGTLKIVNHSNTAIVAKPAWKSDSGFEDAIITFDCIETGLSIASAADTNAAIEGTIKATPTGTLPEGTNGKIGQITITISSASE